MIQVRQKTYRGEDGWVLSGRLPNSHRSLSIFFVHEEAARRTAAKFKADPNYQTNLADYEREEPDMNQQPSPEVREVQPKRRTAIITKEVVYDEHTNVERVEWVANMDGGSFDGLERRFTSRTEVRQWLDNFGYTEV